MYIHYKTREEILNQLFQYFGPIQETDLTTVNIEESEWGVRPLMGCLLKIKPIHCSFGFSLSRTFIVNRDYNYRYVRSYNQHDEEFPEDDYFELLEFTEISEAKREYPYVASVGAAFSKPPFMITGNLTWYSQTDRKDDNATPSTFPTKEFFNGALGLEYHFLTRYTLRLGLFTDYANSETSTIQPTETREVIDMYGGGASVSYERENKFVTVGCIYSRGDGQAALGDFGFGEKQWEEATIDVKKSILILYLSMSM